MLSEWQLLLPPVTVAAAAAATATAAAARVHVQHFGFFYFKAFPRQHPVWLPARA